MTFLEEIKAELENIREKKPCCIKAELRGMLIFGAASVDGALFGTDSFSMAKRFSYLLRKGCNIELPDRVDESADGYKFFVPNDVLAEISLKAEESIIQTDDIEKDACCKRAFVRGAFLAAGSASTPEKSYRMEIFSENEEAAKKVFDILKLFEVDAKMTRRKNLYIVYTNRSESVADMMKVAGCSTALFRVLEAKVLKDRRNSSNRIYNCDIANTTRQADTAARQCAAIERLRKSGKLSELNDKLQTAAQARLDNIDASTAELAQICGISKSAMFSRLEKLLSIAKEL